MIDAEKIQHIVDKTVRHNYIHGVSLCVSSSDGVQVRACAGNLEADSTFYIASTTKIFTSAMILQLVDEGLLELDSFLIDQGSRFTNLLTIDGVDHTASITIRHLLSHTSGLADYFMTKDSSGRSLYDRLTDGNDESWDIDKVLDMSRSLEPRFLPGSSKKAFYSDTNYQILGSIIEAIDNRPLVESIKARITGPLQLSSTYMAGEHGHATPAPMHFKHGTLAIPQAMASFAADGGLISTAEELNVFTKSFFQNELFQTDIQGLSHFNRIFFPLEYGVGFMRYKLPRIFTLLSSGNEMVGHSGHSGAFSYYLPDKQIYLSGTVNQISKPGLSFRMLSRIAAAL